MTLISFSRRNLDNICDADYFLAWNLYSSKLTHENVDNFYRGLGHHQWHCKPKESSQLLFTENMH